MISVIIPTYNGAKYISRAIESVLIQDCGEIELLIMDDWSTDNTRKITEQYCKVHLNFNHTGGPNHGRNKGIKIAKGKYLAFLDQDDYWLPHKLEHQLTMLEKYNQDLAFSMYCCDRADKDIEIDAPIYQDLLNWQHHERWIYPGSILVRNENLSRFYDSQTDYEWLLELTKNRRCIRTIPMVVKRFNGNLSLTEQFRIRNYEQAVKLSARPDRVNASMAKYYYKKGQYKKARRYFLDADSSFKNVAYYLTSFIPDLSRWVVKRFNVFG